MRFLVEMALSAPPTPEIMALLPAETARGRELDAQGIREHLFIAADNSRAWQVFRSDSHAALEGIIQSFPLAPHCTVIVTPLAEPQAG
jgi:muconolactone delta-isomerase